MELIVFMESKELVDAQFSAKHNTLIKIYKIELITLLTFPLGFEFGWKCKVLIILPTVSRKDVKNLGLIF